MHAVENQCFRTGGSLAVDGFDVCNQILEENPELFKVLSEVPVRWENDGGDGSTALVFFGPHISRNYDIHHDGGDQGPHFVFG